MRINMSVISTVILQVEGLCKKYNALTILDHVNLDVKRGEKIAIIGPSGTGKSTLLRCIDLLEPVDSGLIYLEGELVNAYKRRDQFVHKTLRRTTQARKRMWMVFQSFNLFPHMTVMQNIIEAPVNVGGVPRKEAREEAIKLLLEIGLEDKRDAYPSELSGGQQQRVAIIRALAMKPTVMFFDEVTSALDPQLVQGVLDLVKELAHKGMTMLMVTHELAFARDVADRIVFMDLGKIIEEGPVAKMFSDPSHERTREFLKGMLGRSGPI
jgi:ABC-type polar amino acid transport system ATPase subunit